jgi:hypothetical protein
MRSLSSNLLSYSLESQNPALCEILAEVTPSPSPRLILLDRPEVDSWTANSSTESRGDSREGLESVEPNL